MFFSDMTPLPRITTRVYSLFHSTNLCRSSGVADAVADSSPAHDNSHKPQGERSRKMRARILSAAINLLREKGYSAFRVADVAESAGVSRGAQLPHFPTKDQLVAACLEQVF